MTRLDLSAMSIDDLTESVQLEYDSDLAWRVWGIPSDCVVTVQEGRYRLVYDEWTQIDELYLNHDANDVLVSANAADQGAWRWEGGVLSDSTATGVDAGLFAVVNPMASNPDQRSLLETTGVILANATSIGDFAFFECHGLSQASLPNVQTVGMGAFYETGLTSLDLPSATTIGMGAFGGCPSLSTISLPLVEASTLASGAFENCGNLTSLNLSNIDAATVAANATTWGVPYGCTVECANGDTYVRTAPHGSGTSSPALVYDNSNYLAGVKADSNYNTAVRDNKWEWVENGNTRTAVVDESAYTDYWGLGSDYRDIDEGYAMGIASEAFYDYRPYHQGNPLG